MEDVEYSKLRGGNALIFFCTYCSSLECNRLLMSAYQTVVKDFMGYICFTDYGLWERKIMSICLDDRFCI